MSGKRRQVRYSTAFKHKVVSEIELGKITVVQAQKIYDISGGPTIYRWLRKLGKNHLIEKVVRVEMKNEKDKIKELEQQKQQLESALAQAHLKIICLESTISCAEEHFKIDIKKKIVTNVPGKPLFESKKNN